MKLIKIIVLVFLSIAVFSCNHKKNNKETLVNSKLNSKTADKSIIKNAEQNGQEKAQLIELILTSSPRYIELTKGLKEKIVKNGGLGFGVYLERSPQEKMRKEGRYSKTYDFTIHETYEERNLNTSRFSFNPENKQLYEQDVLNDSLVPIVFNRTLLLKYDSLNK